MGSEPCLETQGAVDTSGGSAMIRTGRRSLSLVCAVAVAW